MRHLALCTSSALLAAGCTILNPAFDPTTAGQGDSDAGTTGDDPVPTTAAAGLTAEPEPSPTTADDASTTLAGDGTTSDAPASGGASGSSTGDAATTGAGPFALPDCDAADPFLRACYDFDDPTLLPGETPDGSMFHNDASVSAVNFAPGLEGQSAFVGVGSQIAAPASVSLSDLGALTAAAWFRIEPPVRWPKRMSVLDKRGRFGIFVYADPPDGVTCEVAGARVASGDLADDGAWHHVACVFDGQTLALVLDGVQLGDATAPDEPLPPDSGPLCVAGSGYEDFQFGCVEPLGGTIDAVRVWSRALAPEELCAHAHCP